jgi:hypothetical protein
VKVPELPELLQGFGPSLPSSPNQSVAASRSVAASGPGSRRSYSENMRPLSEIVAELELGQVPRTPSAALCEEWTEFLLRFTFQWFVTFTFREEVHPERAIKCFRLWQNRLSLYLFGRDAERRGRRVFYVVAHEYQKRGVLHFHALIGSDMQLDQRIKWDPALAPWSRLYWEEMWFELAGICRIESIRIAEFASRYVSKYVAKGGQIDVSENLKHYAPAHQGRPTS